MNILFLSISSFPHLSDHSLSTDLLQEFKSHGHDINIVCALDKNTANTTYLTVEEGCRIVRVKIGDNKKANLIRKGITVITEPFKYIRAIKRFFGDIQFDLVIYPTPPITQAKVVAFVKKRDCAKSYLILRDIFPQGAVDIGVLKKNGCKKIIYLYFRNVERKLYCISDYIGCLSQANVDYVLKNNLMLKREKIEICPNSIQVFDKSVNEEIRKVLRNKYDIPLDKTVFVYGGNLGKPQGIPFLLECLKAATDIPEAFFLIVGDGTEYNRIERYVCDGNQQNMKLIKKLPREEYDTLVAACDVGMIFLDHRFKIPNYPSRLLSYMQARIPVMAFTDPNTDIGKAIDDGGFGWWRESNSTEGFIEVIRDALHADLPTMGNRGFDYLDEHFSVSKQYRTIIAHFEDNP